VAQGTRVVVIGFSGHGAHAAMTLKRLHPSLDVTVIREEPHLLIRCAIPVSYTHLTLPTSDLV